MPRDPHNPKTTGDLVLLWTATLACLAVWTVVGRLLITGVGL